MKRPSLVEIVAPIRQEEMMQRHDLFEGRKARCKHCGAPVLTYRRKGPRLCDGCLATPEQKSA